VINGTFTSESVTEGHPDKVADQISDAILDACLAQDPHSRVACETLVTRDRVVIAGEITTGAVIDPVEIARQTIRTIGYTQPGIGFDADTCTIDAYLSRQTEDIGQGVDSGGAGDQGMMFGYACEETAELMPLPITLAHALTRRLTEVRRNGVLPWLRPDGKAQVSVEYRDGHPARIAAVVLSAQHAADVPADVVRSSLLSAVIRSALPLALLDDDTRLHINPTGRFVEGGPAADCGLTGRKIIVDTYGGYAPHGGGAFSGKDGTKVDRSAAYMARYVAQNLVRDGLARQVLVQLSYAIGVAEPVSVLVSGDGRGASRDATLEALVRAHYALSPQGIIDTLRLREPVFAATARNGHFGRADFAWERPRLGAAN
jgi:S-adenosylmethionine synthetase